MVAGRFFGQEEKPAGSAVLILYSIDYVVFGASVIRKQIVRPEGLYESKGTERPSRHERRQERHTSDNEARRYLRFDFRFSAALPGL